MAMVARRVVSCCERPISMAPGRIAEKPQGVAPQVRGARVPRNAPRCESRVAKSSRKPAHAVPNRQAPAIEEPRSEGVLRQ